MAWRSCTVRPSPIWRSWSRTVPSSGEDHPITHLPSETAGALHFLYRISSFWPSQKWYLLRSGFWKSQFRTEHHGLHARDFHFEMFLCRREYAGGKWPDFWGKQIPPISSSGPRSCWSLQVMLWTKCQRTWNRWLFGWRGCGVPGFHLSYVDFHGKLQQKVQRVIFPRPNDVALFVILSSPPFTIQTIAILLNRKWW